MVQIRDDQNVERVSESFGTPEVKPPKRIITRIPARLVGTAGTTYLVEWAVEDDFKRAYIPGETWNEKGVDEEVLAAGVPYGVDWASIIKLHNSPANLAKVLRASGIWTNADFRTRIEEVEGLFKRATQADVFSVLGKMEG